MMTPRLKAPWYQTILWGAFQIAVALTVFCLVREAEDRPYYPQEGAGQTAALLAGIAAMAATFIISWLLRGLRFIAKKRRRRGRRQAIVAGSGAEQWSLPRNDTRALGRQKPR